MVCLQAFWVKQGLHTLAFCAATERAVVRTLKQGLSVLRVFAKYPRSGSNPAHAARRGSRPVVKPVIAPKTSGGTLIYSAARVLTCSSHLMAMTVAPMPPVDGEGAESDGAWLAAAAAPVSAHSGSNPMGRC